MAIQPVGYLKLYRELASKPIWEKSTPEQKVVLITLLLMANFAPKQWEWEGQQYTAEPGQFVTSLDSIAKDSGIGVTIQNVRSSLKRFEKFGFLTNESTKTGRLITIANWALYQSDDCDPTKTPTKTQQRPNKDPTKHPTPKEESKESKKERKKEINTLASFDAEIDAYTENPVLAFALKDFIEHRKEIKKPMTERALRLTMNELDKIASSDSDKVEILNRSIANRWQGVFPLDKKQLQIQSDNPNFRGKTGQAYKAVLEWVPPEER